MQYRNYSLRAWGRPQAGMPCYRDRGFLAAWRRKSGAKSSHHRVVLGRGLWKAKELCGQHVLCSHWSKIPLYPLYALNSKLVSFATVIVFNLWICFGFLATQGWRAHTYCSVRTHVSSIMIEIFYDDMERDVSVRICALENFSMCIWKTLSHRPFCSPHQLLKNCCPFGVNIPNAHESCWSPWQVLHSNLIFFKYSVPVSSNGK